MKTHEKKICSKQKTCSSWLNRAFALLLAGVLAFSSPVAAAAAEPASAKEEAVYAMLNADGTINGMYVVNIFDQSGSIVDYGDYSAVRNMTSDDKITQNGNKITVTNTGQELYYEGTLQKPELPWNIAIKYELDGKEYSADQIAGKSGALTIRMRITQNESCNETFYKNYALQAALTLDSGKCKNIKADGATMANVGGDKQLTYTILPDKGADITITADVTDFTMDAVTINGIRLNLNIQVDDSALMQKVDELKSSAVQLDNGADALKNGVSAFQGGADQWAAGANDLKNGSAHLDGGVTALQSGIKQVQGGLNDLNSKSATLTGGSAQIKSALGQIQSSLVRVSMTSDQIDALVNASSGIKKAINGIYFGIDALKSNVGYSQYKAAMSAGGLDIDALKAGNTEAVNTLTAQIASLTASYNSIKDIPGYEAQAAALKTQVDQLTGIVSLLNGNNAAIGGTETYLNNVAASITQLYNGAAELKLQYEVFDAKIAELGQILSSLLVDMTDLAQGINTLVAQYSALDSGISDYTNGVARIVAGYSGVVNGVNDLAAGSKSLSGGSNTLYTGTTALMVGVHQLYGGAVDLQNGTGEFKAKTANMDTEVSNQVDEALAQLTGDKSQPVSFVSSENANVKSVQFVIKTKAIEIPEQVNSTTEPVKTLNLWQKILRLFGLD